MSLPVKWFEVLSPDPGRARRFYGELFQWKYDVLPEMDYGMVAPADGGIGGGVGRAPQGPGWTTFYVAVPDVDGTVAQATAMGSSVLLPKTDLPDGAQIAVVTDPDGRPVGLFRPKPGA